MIDASAYNIKLKYNNVIMNPLGVSVIFVICSILLSFLKHMLFPSSEAQSSITKFNKVFQLTDNKVQSHSKYYKSLYEAYHRTQILDAEKYTSFLPNRSMFNQSVLRKSLLNQEVSFMCGSEYLVLVLSGVSVGKEGGGYTRWINVFEVYRLPLMTKIDEIKINGKTILPQQCKQTNTINKYQMSIISKIGPMMLVISQNSAQMTRLSRSSELNYYLEIDKFDFDGQSIAYWSKQHPWVIRIETNRIIKSNVYAELPSHKHEQEHLSHTDTPIEINLLNIQIQQTQSYEHTQHLALQHIYLTHFNSKIYLTVVYNYHNLGSKKKYIVMSSFEIDHDTMALLSRIIIDVELNCMQEIKTECMKYINQKTNVYDLSCVMLKNKGEIVKFINSWDIYMLNSTKKGYGCSNGTTYETTKKKKKREYDQDQDYYEDGYADWIDDHLEDVYDQSDDDLVYMQSMTPLASNSYFKEEQNHPHNNRLSLIFKAPKMNKMKMIKPSLPDPIVYYADGDNHHMFTFNLPTKEVQEEQQQISLSTLFFSFSPPISDKEEEKALRDIKLIEKEHLIVVVWGGGIEVYEYQNMQFPKQNGQGIAMSVILPFIQLFATVFCLLRIVWNPQ